MVRISLKEAYDDRSVIKKIADLEANKQNKLTAGQGVSIEGTTISVDTSDLATKTALDAETARLDTRIDDVDAKIPPLASKAELADEAARLDAKIDNVDAKIPPLASKAELADEAARLDAKIDTGDRDLSSRIDASNVKIKTNADAILTIENELGSDALPGTIYYRISKVEGEVITLKPLVNDSIKKVDVEGDASTVYHKALHNSGIVENDAIPVASDTKAGVMSAGMYVGFNGSIQNLQARMAVLEGVGITYQLTGLPDNATSEQITAAFQAQYPNVPLMAGIRVADYDKAKIWQYSGTAWIQLTSININIATSSALGLVKGSETSTTNDGKIFVEVDGSMTVIGWDTLKALASAAKQSVDNLEPKVTQQSAKIDALEGDVAANAADITALQNKSANHESRISSLETTSSNLGTRMGTAESDIDNLQASDTQQTSKISSLETTSANLGTRLGTAENDIDTLQASDSQQTSKISALEADMNNVKPRVGQLESDVGTLETKVDQHTQSISGLSTDVNKLKTEKQDKLIAGSNITIGADGKTISADSYVPVTRVVTGRESVLSEFKFFMANGKIGDTLRIESRWEKNNIVMWGPPVSDSYNEPTIVLGDYNQITNEEYIKIQPYSEIEVISEDIYNNDTYKTISFEGKCYIKESGGSETDNVGLWNISYKVAQNVGVISSYGAMYVPLAFNYPTLYEIKKSGVNIGIKETDPVYDLKAIANYERK